MADGNSLSGAQPAAAEANADRRGPLRPARLVSPRARLSGRMLVRAFMAADAAFLLLAALVFDALKGWTRPEALLGAILSWIVLVACGAYGLRRRELTGRHLALVAAAAAVGWAATQAFGSMLRPVAASMGDAVWAIYLTLGLGGLHLLWLRIIRRLRANGKLTPNIVIVGATPAARRLIRWALETKGAVNVLGVFDDRRGRAGPSVNGVPILGGTADLADHRILPYVDRVVISVPAAASGRIAQLTELLGAVPNPITLLLDGKDDQAERASIERIADFALQQISGGQRSALGGIAKRALDLAVGCVAAVVLSPALAGVALAVRLDSPGPVLFRQKRHGYLNEAFWVFKFRSMRIEAEDAQARRQVSAGDDRVTRVGRFIRKTSLDELPQLFNVIRGEMSLVGPRPHAIGMLVEGAEAARLFKTYAHRHRIKPGLTGWAAIHGSRGPVETPEAVRRRVELDLEYIERQSFWLDLWIMLRTLPCLLGDSSAVR
jgi:Undecaprenyl-phosphate glucose phosphotransferase